MGAIFQELFEAQAARTPQRTALKAGTAALSYGELDGRANRLAQALRARGVGRGQRVGLCLERGADMLAAVLGIVKAGAAYIPLDPSLPQDRLRFMAEDAGLTLLVSTSAAAAPFGLPRDRQLLLDADAAALAEQPDQRLEPDASLQARPEDPAYVMYTSGSTGKPKGVVVPHSAVVNFLTSVAREPGLRADDVLLAVTTLSFDMSVLELQLPLTVGATVVIAGREDVIDGHAIKALLHQHHATVMQATPVTWRLLLEAGWQAPPGFKALVGGEALPRDLAGQLLPQGLELWNMYGPTETTVWSTCSRIVDPADIHIGRPIANTDLYILDEQGQPAADGVIGELLIGGEGLANGYFNRPELTGEKFIAHPFKPGSRLYRTGDLACRRSDGNFDCLGRIDFQVKIRGYRIELGEIEALLSQHPRVKEAVVTASEDASGEKRLVAYLVMRDRDAIDPDQLREFLRSKLPEYMIPAVYVSVAKIPLTPYGKIDRKALPPPTAEAVKAAPAAVPPGTPLQEAIAAIWKEVLGLPSVDWHTNFFDLGGHSLLVARAHARLRNLGHEVSIVDLYQHPTISKLAAHLSPDKQRAASSVPATPARTPAAGDSIAIIGMAGRFPGARDLGQFWNNLRNGVESVSFFSDEELRAAGVPDELIADPTYVRAKAIVDEVEHFDARFFGYSPGEATLLDPQQRIFLEAAWTALEDAGYSPDQQAASIGVYAGASPNLYMFQVLAGQSGNLTGYGFPMTVHQEKDYLATRVSYELNLKGPSVTVQTACSTSLVAVHMACRALLGGECDMALAGAVSVQVPQHSGYLYQEGGIGSKDGHCRVFDAEASGTVFGNGVGIVVLKRLSDALRDRDPIRAVIKSTAINNDGSGKMGFTAPSVEGQAEVIAMAHRGAGLIDAGQISYVEAHGTGTVVGDPIEVSALTQAFRATTNRTGFCAVGSVKSNIGHLDAAAGMAGLIKTVLALEHREIPPTLNFRAPNPGIDFAHSPFYVNAELAPWNSEGPLRAGISSFGVGGTNSHVILEEAPQPPASRASQLPKLLVFSAATPAALDRALSNFREHLRVNPALDLGNASYTLQTGRHAFDVRQALVCEDGEEALRLLDPATRPAASHREQAASKIVFMFTGQGSQYAGMGAELYRREPLFRNIVDECLEKIRPFVDVDLRKILWPGPEDANSSAINQTAFTQPLLFIIEYAVARLWMHWGIEPYVMIGHSVGEYVAACLADVLSLEDALALVARRGRLMQGLPQGSMLAVPAPRQQVEEWLGRPEWQGRLCVAAVNAPELSVVSGPTEDIRKFEAALIEQGQSPRPLHTSHAFHSSMMDPILEEFTAAVRQVKLHPPRIPCISNLTGTWLTDAQAMDPHYYAQHLRQAVRFSEGIQEIAREMDPVFLEVGPGQTLKSLAKRHRFDGRNASFLHSLPAAADKASDSRTLVGALGSLWCLGKTPDWTRFHADGNPRRVPLPTYPFERQRYAVDIAAGAKRPPSMPRGKRPVDDWFYTPGWKSSTAVAAEPGQAAGRTCLVFRADQPFHDRLAQRIRDLGYSVLEVFAARDFRSIDSGRFDINPAESAQYSRLLGELKRQGKAADLVVHLWGLGRSASGPAGQGAEDEALDLEFFPLVYFTQALSALDMGAPLDIKILVDGSVDVMGDAVTRPENALAMGPCIVIPQEFDNITASCIDVDLNFADPSGESRLLDQLAGEISRKNSDELVAYRGQYRWTRTYDALRLPAPPDPPPALKRGGVYLITGGLGGMGLELADYLAKTVQAKMILVGRTALPPQEAKMARLRRMESYGAEILVLSAEVSDREQMRSALRGAHDRFGRIDGVIHAAGVMGGGVIQRKSREEAMAVLRAKVQGTRVLSELLVEEPPDFLVLCSSVNSVVGGFGQVDYCAANAFLDAFAHSHPARAGMRTLSVDWDMWSEVGLAMNTDVPAHLQAQRSMELELGITVREGLDAFSRLLGCALPQVLVSTREFTEMQASRRSVGRSTDQSVTAAVPVPAAGHPRPELTTSYIAPADDIERTVSAIWQRALGLDRVGVGDNFFELGGDSLLAVQVVGQIRQAMKISFPVAAFYADPTIASLKKHLMGDGTAAAETSASEVRREARQGLGRRAQRLRQAEAGRDS
jgi:amino acid adenylation domain-containing protein